MRRLRIARTRTDAARPVKVNEQAAYQAAPRLADFLRRHGAPGLDGFLAQPEPSADGAQIDWYTSHPGTAIALTSLVGNDRFAIEERLAVRLAQLRDLAKSAPADIAQLLAAAARYPGPEHVFAVGREPVLAMWGHDDPALAATNAAPASGAAAPVVGAGSRRWWLAGLAALLLIAALLLLSFCWRQEEPVAPAPPAEIALPPVLPLDPDLVAKLEAERARAEELRKQLAALEDDFAEKLKACTPPAAVPPALPPAVEPVPAPEAAAPAPPPPPPAKKVEKPQPPPVKKELPKPAKQAEAQIPPAAPSTPIPPAATKNQCEKLTPSRKKWEAPEVVFVVDGSGSMQESAGGQSRLDAAKDSVGYIADHLPADIDTALVKFTDCNAVDNDYFLSRPQLKSKVNQLQPSGGTPIGRSIERAARILSPTKETVMVVVTDGEDTCKSTDPCEAARQAKASHPNLTINVVDVSGQGLGSCIAQNGGGRVLPANTSVEVKKAIQDATDQVMLPSECVGGK
jgi:outer membrane biosynthesis protein TonB